MADVIPHGVRMLFDTKSLVVVESPFGNPDPWVVEHNLAYARACVRWCLQRGMAPFASHCIYPQCGLDDQDPASRRLGMEAGFAVNKHAAATIVFTDLDVSSGVEAGIADAVAHGRPVFRMKLPGWRP